MNRISASSGRALRNVRTHQNVPSPAMSRSSAPAEWHMAAVRASIGARTNVGMPKMHFSAPLVQRKTPTIAVAVIHMAQAIPCCMKTIGR
jgi:hypothetical protein